MATGGIFQLITNDGKQDKMLMASALLASRIATARNNRKCAGQSDCTPTLYDIERTHILFTLRKLQHQASGSMQQWSITGVNQFENCTKFVHFIKKKKQKWNLMNAAVLLLIGRTLF